MDNGYYNCPKSETGVQPAMFNYKIPSLGSSITSDGVFLPCAFISCPCHYIPFCFMGEAQVPKEMSKCPLQYSHQAETLMYQHQHINSQDNSPCPLSFPTLFFSSTINIPRSRRTLDLYNDRFGGWVEEPFLTRLLP